MKFNEVWSHVEGFVRGYAYNQCSRDPEDPVSKTMYSLWVAFENGKLNDLEHAKAYALRSIKCEVARWWSNNQRRMEFTERLAEFHPTHTPSNAVESADLDDLLEDLQALRGMVLEVAGNLSLMHQKVMACRLHGMSHRQTAKLCDIGLPTVGRKLKDIEDELNKLDT